MRWNILESVLLTLMINVVTIGFAVWVATAVGGKITELFVFIAEALPN